MIIQILLSSTIYANAASSVDVYSHGKGTVGDDIGKQKYWNISPGNTIDYYIHYAGTPDISGTNEFAAVQRGFQTWENDPASYIDYTYKGTTTRSASIIENSILDGYSVVKWVNNVFVGLGITLDNTVFTNSNVITEVDIAFNDSFTWCINGASGSDGCTTGEHDVETVALHEAGHTLFLDDLSYDSSQVMYFDYMGVRTQLQYGDRAGVRYIYANTVTAGSSVGTETQDADIAIAEINNSTNNRPDIVIAWADNPAGANTIKYRYGWDISTTGTTSSWSSDNSISNIGDETQGVGVSLVNLDSNARRELIIAWIDNPSGNNTIKYRIGWNIDTSGNPSSWSTTKNVPSSDVGNESQGLGIAFVNIDNNSRPEMFVFWVDNPLGSNRIYYKIGWNVNTSGDAASWSTRIDTNVSPGDETAGLGVSIANWLVQSQPDILVFWIDNPIGNNKGYYVVGVDISSSGYPTWQARKEIPNYFRGVGDESQGAGVAIINIGNNDNNRVEAVFLWIDNPILDNYAKYRVEWSGRMGTNSHK